MSPESCHLRQGDTGPKPWEGAGPSTAAVTPLCLPGPRASGVPRGGEPTRVTREAERRCPPARTAWTLREPPAAPRPPRRSHLAPAPTVAILTAAARVGLGGRVWLPGPDRLGAGVLRRIPGQQRRCPLSRGETPGASCLFPGGLVVERGSPSRADERAGGWAASQQPRETQGGLMRILKSQHMWVLIRLLLAKQTPRGPGTGSRQPGAGASLIQRCSAAIDHGVTEPRG